MRTVTVAVHQFDELSAKAQLKACDWARNNIHDLYAWHDEAKQSIEAFCDKFGVTLRDYQISPWDALIMKQTPTMAISVGFA